jgi:adenylate cyclase
VLVVLYGKILGKAHIDIIGSSVSMASKIASIAQPNQVFLGESIYDILLSSKKDNNKDWSYNRFLKVNLDLFKWNYKSHSSGNVYSVYRYLE